MSSSIQLDRRQIGSLNKSEDIHFIRDLSVGEELAPESKLFRVFISGASSSPTFSVSKSRIPSLWDFNQTGEKERAYLTKKTRPK